MSSAMVDTAAAPPLKQPTSRRPRSAALSNSNANAGAGAGAGAPKPKVKTVASRYLSPISKSTSTSKPATSPAKASVATAAASRRSASPARTFSVAFQSPAYCLDTNRARSVSPAAAFSPEKRWSSTADTSARSKVSEGGQNTYRWPASAPSGHDAASAEHSASNYKRTAGARPRAFDETPRRASVDGGANECLRALLSSDTDSASSGGSGGDGLGADMPPALGPRPSPRSVLRSSATGTRSDRFAAYPASAGVASPSPVKKRSLFNGLLSSSPFSRLPLKKQQSPSKSAFRTTESPSRPRRPMDLPRLAGKLLQGKACSLDNDDMKVTQNKAEEEHQLKLLYTRHLQWRHANAKAAAARSTQRKAAEKTLIGAWIAILRVRKSVAVTKLQLQLLQNNCKLMATLRGQMIYLEEWFSLERVYAKSLSGTALALNATVLRLPVIDGAMADIQALKNAVGSAIDVIQRIGNSTSIQLSKLARANVLVSQLSRVVIQELVLIARCRELLSTVASLHVKHCSLQGQRIQQNQRRLGRFQ